MVPDVENLKRLRELKLRLPPADWEEFSRMNLDEKLIKGLENYDYGLSTEEEFHYIAHLLGRTARVEAIDQAAGDSKGPISPDFFVVFTKYRNVSESEEDKTFPCYVEVKRAWNLRWKISRRDLDRRARFALRNGYPLLFAIKFVMNASAFWTLFTTDYIRQRGLRLGLTDHRNSWFDFLTGDFQLHLPACEVEFTYEQGRSGVVEHPQRGGLTRLRVRVDGRTIETPTSPYWRWVFFAFSPARRSERKRGRETIVTKNYESQINSAHFVLDTLISVLQNLDSATQRSRFRVDFLRGEVSTPGELEIVGAIAYEMMREGLIQVFRWAGPAEISRADGVEQG